MNDRKPTMSDMVIVKKTPEQPRVAFRSEVKKERDFDEEKIIEKRQMIQSTSFKKDPKLFLKFSIVFCIIVLTIGIGGLFSGAQIELIPITKTGPVDITIVARTQPVQNQIMIATATKIITDTRILPAIGKIEKTSFAKGKVRFYNSKSEMIKVPAGTIIVASDGTRYKTDKLVSIPKGGSKTTGQVDGLVTSFVAGALGNKELDNFTFENKSFTGITIRSVTEIIGGADGDDFIADPTMIAQAKKELSEMTIDSVGISNRLAEEIPDSFIRLPLGENVTRPIITLEASHPDGVHVVAQREVTIAMVKKAEIAQLFAKDLGMFTDRLVTVENFNGLSVVAGGVGSAYSSLKELPLRITGTATIVGLVNTQEIKTNLLGKTKKQAKTILGDIKELTGFTIRMTPPWRNVMSGDPKDINFLIKKGVN